VRQGGVLSPYLYAFFIDDILKNMKKLTWNIILLAPSVESLQRIFRMCENELAWLDMSLNPKKSLCIRFGPRNAACKFCNMCNMRSFYYSVCTCHH